MNHESSSPAYRAERRKVILWLLLLAILANIALRYPLDHAIPHGSDTFSILELGKSVADNGEAKWILDASSYVGFFPLSYPSGIPFLSAETQMLGGGSWNSIPLILSLFFVVLMVLGGFIFFRAFRVSDMLSVALAGLMASSPLFMYYTYEQAAARGFAIPILILSVSCVFLNISSSWRKAALLGAFVACSPAIHKSGLIIVLFVCLACLAVVIAPFLPRRLTGGLRLAAFACALAAIVVLFLWPFVPGLSGLFSGVKELSSTYRIAEYEFATGYLLEGDSPLTIVVNLSSNYAGGIGLLILLFPLGVLSLYPCSNRSRGRDMFLLLMLIVVAPVIWKAQYMTVILLPFFYLLAGLAISNRSRYFGLLRRLPWLRRNRHIICARTRKLVTNALVASFLVACVLFSTVLFIHRENLTWQGTGATIWPSDDEVNCGIYIGSTDLGGDEKFVSPSGLLDRQIGWFSRWRSPVGDASVLRAEGYLSATSNDFSLPFSGIPDWPNLLASFYGLGNAYVIDPEVADRYKYYLSWDDTNGFYRLYFDNPESAFMYPRVSTAEAGISVVIELNAMGDRIPDGFSGVGTRISLFLQDVSSSTYLAYMNEDYSCFLAANPLSGG